MARTTSFLSKNNEWSFLDENEDVIPLGIGNIGDINYIPTYSHNWVVENGQGGLISDYKHIYSHHAFRVNPNNSGPVIVKLLNQTVPANITESEVLADRSASERIKFITISELPDYTYSNGVITSTGNERLVIDGRTLLRKESIPVTQTLRTGATYIAIGHTFNVGDLVTVTGATPDAYSVIDKAITGVTADTFTVGDVPLDVGGFASGAKVTAVQPAYEIGDVGPGGGTIFITPSTHGNTLGLYYEVAPASVEVQRTWAQSTPVDYQSTSALGVDGVAIGTGYANTLNIVGQGNSTSATSAAAYCDNLTYGGFVDWFLPSQEELDRIYAYLKLNNIGDLNSVSYWSSTETSSSTAAAQDFSDGYKGVGFAKSLSQYVRPVRSFAEESTLLDSNPISGVAVSGNGENFTYTSINHGYVVGSIVTVTGATIDLYNVTNKIIISRTADTFSVEPYSIGDTGPAGGHIFLTPSTEGNNTGEYFEAGPVELEIDAVWAQLTPVNYQNTAVTGADGIEIGDGVQNTLDIIAQGNNDIEACAAPYCDSINLDGFTDWFLPSSKELKEIDENLHFIGIGNLSNTYYWSSSEENASNAKSRYFNTHATTFTSKDASQKVRPIRSFVLTSPGGFATQISATNNFDESFVVTNISQNNVTYVTTGHNLSVGQLVTVTDALPAGYNIVSAPISSVTETTFTITGIVPNLSPMSKSGIVNADGDEGTRVLVKSETGLNQKYNGVYTVTNSGGPYEPWVLTRKESFPLIFNCMTRSDIQNITTSVKLYESGGTAPTEVQPYTGNAGKYEAVRSNVFNSFSSLYPYQVDIEITVTNHGGSENPITEDYFYITLPFLYNYYAWLGNIYVQNARRQYLPHFYWDIDSQQDPDYPFYKLLDSMTYKADEVMQSYSNFFTYELSELPVGAEGTEAWATSTLTTPENVSLANRDWLSQFTGGHLNTTLPAGVMAGSVNLDAFIEWQLVNKYCGYKAGSTEALREVVKLCLTGDKNIAIGPNADNDIWKIKIYTLLSETPVDYEIGDTGPGGGVVFITPTTAGNTSGKYFEVAPAAVQEARRWAETTYQSSLVTGADGEVIGTGEQNTLDIIAQGNTNEATSAAKFCASLDFNGYTDWFLPSRNELEQLYINKSIIGDFDNLHTWWSSTEEDASTAWNRAFGDGSEDAGQKYGMPIARPVRSFNNSPTVLALAELVRPMGYLYVHEAVSSIDFILDNVAAGILDISVLGSL
jgi:hypothetical protein